LFINLTQVISVKFRHRGKPYFFSPGRLTVKNGDNVIVDTAKGREFGECVYGNHYVADTAVVQPLRPVIRVASQQDIAIAEQNYARERESMILCRKKIAEHGLEMKLVDAELSFDGGKLTFFFTSDGRVDFRSLVKDLAGLFRTRIELRQIGVRDEAKLLGGLGVCGRALCCAQFLDEFRPVSTKMAKVQSLSLNPTKISGSCGRLMCCLRYEQSAYEDLVRKVPKLGEPVTTPEGDGVTVGENVLRQTVKVKLDGEGEPVIKTFKVSEIGFEGKQYIDYDDDYTDDEEDISDELDLGIFSDIGTAEDYVSPSEREQSQTAVGKKQKKKAEKNTGKYVKPPAAAQFQTAAPTVSAPKPKTAAAPPNTVKIHPTPSAKTKTYKNARGKKPYNRKAAKSYSRRADDGE